MKRFIPISVVVAAVILCATSAFGQVSYCDFCSVSDFTLNGVTGSLTPNGDCALRLTNDLSQSGSAFLTDPISLASDASFSTAFSFQITNPKNGGADGIVFVVQTVASNVGGSGGGIGYQGISNSVGVEFDTWDNDSGYDPDASHIGIDLNGSVASVVTTSISPALDNGEVWYAWVDYDGSSDTLEVRVSQSPSRPASPDLMYTVDLVSVLGQTDAYVGFTSGTGGAANVHDILSWEFVPAYAPIPTLSEWAALTLGLVLALLGIAVLRRRKAHGRPV